MIYRVQHQLDPFWTAVTDPYDMESVRLTYRFLRRSGVGRWAARSAIHRIFHVGIRAQVERQAARKATA